MASQIKIKRSSVAGKVPTTSDIASGELAINVHDKRLYSSNGSTVFEFTTRYLTVANAVVDYLTKNNPVITGTLTANGSVGTDGYYLRTSGSSIYWSPVAGGGGSSSNGFSGILVGANVISADSTTDRLTLVAGSGIALAANPTTDTITITATGVSSSGATWTALTSTNTALRTLISDRLQVANAVATYQTKAVERAALANTNSYIATKASWTGLTGTNTAIRALVSDRYQVANVNTLLAAKATWAALTSTNTAIRTYVDTSVAAVVNSAPGTLNTLYELAAALSNDPSFATSTAALIATKISVANAASTYLTKNNPVVTGTLTANGSVGTAGYYLRTSGSGIYWSPVAGGGGGTFTGGTISGATTVSNTTASTSNLTGAFKVTGGVGVTGNIYTAGRVGYASNTTSGTSAVYTYYNSAAGSLDTVFG